MGLTMDEAALLLDLEDVYWTRQGLLSVQVSLGVTATLAATILGLRMLRRGEEKGVAGGPDPRPRARHALDGRAGLGRGAEARLGLSPIQITWSRPGPTPTSRIGMPRWSEIAAR